ncbi:MAG: NAD(P)-dependent oxidoreductase [Xanthomonadales bacterium]|nr:NAD(P)-dependent oxidoreductase [Xanthomonadales bacterium]
MRVGMIGLGAMGLPMARHLADAGLLRAAWNRSRDKADALAAEAGVATPSTLAELAAACNVVVICVSADGDLREVVAAMRPGLAAGTTVVDTSTVSPVTAREIGADLAELGIGFVDAPLSGGVEGAAKGTLSVMAGGDSADFERILPVLETFSARVTRMGPVGAGQATKAVNQVIVGGVAEAVCEALALSEKLNLPSERLLQVLGAGAAGSWFLQHRGKSMLEDRFERGFKLSLLLKDLKIVQALARELDIPMSGVDMAIRDYQQLVEAGDGDHDISGLIRLKRSPPAVIPGTGEQNTHKRDD